MTTLKTKHILVSLSLLLVATAGVVAQRRRAPAAKAPSAAADYFPLRTGDTWTYKHSEGTQFTFKVINEEKQSDGTVRYVMELTSGTKVHYIYSKTKGWVLQHRQSYPLESTGLKIDYDPPRQHLKNPLIPGEKWDWYGKDVGGNDVAENNQVIGLEWVTVPAGKFHAMKVASRVSNGGTVANKTYWYVDGVGLVKSWTEAGVIRYGFELTDYSFKK